VKLKYDLQSIFAVMAWGGGGGVGGGCRCPFYDGVSRASSDGDGRMLVIGENFMPGVMNGLGVWDTKDGVGNHVNTVSLAEMGWWGESATPRRFRTNDSGGGGGEALPLTSGVAKSRDCEAIRDEATERLSFRTSIYPDKEIHILSLTFDSFFASNVCGSSHFARLFPFLVL
jgi:hypothetical protein